MDLSMWQLLFDITIGLCGVIVLLGVWIVWSIGPTANRSRGSWSE